MLKQNGMVMLPEEELAKMIEKEAKEQTKALEIRNELLRKALMKMMQALTTNEKGFNDIRVSKMDFLKIYNDALDEMFDNPNEEENDIYGHDITVHWHGIYCNCGDGATAYNHIIQAIKGVCEEDNEEWIED